MQLFDEISCNFIAFVGLGPLPVLTMLCFFKASICIHMGFYDCFFLIFVVERASMKSQQYRAVIDKGFADCWAIVFLIFNLSRPWKRYVYHGWC